MKFWGDESSAVACLLLSGVYIFHIRRLVAACVCVPAGSSREGEQTKVVGVPM